MVNFVGIHGVTAYIEVDNPAFLPGEALREYTDDDLTASEGSSRSVARYIESQAGQGFRVVILVHRNATFVSQALSFQIFIDGHTCDGIIVYRDMVAQHRFSYVSRGKGATAGTILPYQFSGLRKEEDGSNIKPEQVKHLGRIDVVVKHCKVISQPQIMANRPSATAVKASEKALKGQAMSHTVAYGQPVSVPPRTSVEVVHVSRSMQANFFYRSRDDLRALLIIPRTPSPAPVEDRDPEDVSIDDIRAMQEELRKLRESQGDGSGRKIKRERLEDSPASNQKRQKKAPVTMVLGDDDEFTVEGTTTETVDLS